MAIRDENFRFSGCYECSWNVQTTVGNNDGVTHNPQFRKIRLHCHLSFASHAIIISIANDDPPYRTNITLVGDLIGNVLASGFLKHLTSLIGLYN
jgi:hypothetical protein